jgi:hypothetical protein
MMLSLLVELFVLVVEFDVRVLQGSLFIHIVVTHGLPSIHIVEVKFDDTSLAFVSCWFAVANIKTIDEATINITTSDNG